MGAVRPLVDSTVGRMACCQRVSRLCCREATWRLDLPSVASPLPACRPQTPVREPVLSQPPRTTNRHRPNRQTKRYDEAACNRCELPRASGALDDRPEADGLAGSGNGTLVRRERCASRVAPAGPAPRDRQRPRSPPAGAAAGFLKHNRRGAGSLARDGSWALSAGPLADLDRILTFRQRSGCANVAAGRRIAGRGGLRFEPPARSFVQRVG